MRRSAMLNGNVNCGLKQNLSYFCPAVKNICLAILFVGFLSMLAACEKNTPPVIVPPPVPEDTVTYAGTYDGWVNKHSAGVNAIGVYKIDTAYAYSVTISDEGIGLISIHGSDAPSIAVDSNGYFKFNEFNHNIEGNFIRDSLYLFTEAISGSYDPPQFYDNTQMNFAGKKVQ